MRAADRPTSSWPSSSTDPESGRNWPPSTLKQVDLPAPFGPIKASIWPASSVKETFASASERRLLCAAVEYFVTPVDAEADLEIGGLDDDEAVLRALTERLGVRDLLQAAGAPHHAPP